MPAEFSPVEGRYGITDICLSLPPVIDRGGIQRVQRLELDESEVMKPRHSAEVLRNTVAALELN